MTGYSIFRSKYPYEEIEKIFKEYYPTEGFDKAVKKGTFCFPVFLTEKLCNDTMWELDVDLTVRDYNTLKRSGFETIGDVFHRYEEMISLIGHKNLTYKLLRNAMCELFLHQFKHLTSEQKKDYLELVVELSLADADPKLSDYYIGKPYMIMIFSKDNPTVTRSYQNDIQTYVFHDTLFTIKDMDDDEEEEDIYSA